MNPVLAYLLVGLILTLFIMRRTPAILKSADKQPVITAIAIIMFALLWLPVFVISFFMSMKKAIKAQLEETAE